MFTFIKSIILGCFEEQQTRNKRKTVPLYSQQQRLSGKIWESQFINTRKGVM